MLDEKDLQAIAQFMDRKLSEQSAEIISQVTALVENEVSPKFNLLTDSISGIHEKLDSMPGPDLLEKMQEELDLHHDMLKLHSSEISKLKKAQ